MVVTSAAAPGQAAGSTTNNTRITGSELDQDAFLQILVSQLQNQDPLSPMEDKDFIAQMAQFSVLEQIQALNANFSFSQASSLIGKNVYAKVANENGSQNEIYGPVTSVMTISGAPYLEVNGQMIPYNQDIVVYDYADPLAPQAGDLTPVNAAETAANETATTEAAAAAEYTQEV